MSEEKSSKKSQKRVDRQKRRAERQRIRAEQSDANKKIRDPYPQIRVRLQKKSLPGFLAKNADAIIQWLKDYQLLYIAADDYGFLNMERFPEARLKHVVDNYVQLIDFISTLECIKSDSSAEVISSELSCNFEQTENNLSSIA